MITIIPTARAKDDVCRTVRRIFSAKSRAVHRTRRRKPANQRARAALLERGPMSWLRGTRSSDEGPTRKRV